MRETENNAVLNKKRRHIKKLKKNFEFNYVYRKGVSSASREIVLISAKNRNGETKIGFSVSKKIGKSVVRNHAKRMMREAVISCYDSMQNGYNYVLAARAGINSSNYRKICDSLLYLLKKSGRYDRGAKAECSVREENDCAVKK